MSFKVISAEEAALHIHDDDNVGFGGFTAAGTPKVVPQAIARRAEEEHAAGRPFRIGVFTGASTSDRLDGALSRAKAIKFRTRYQCRRDYLLRCASLGIGANVALRFSGKNRRRRYRSDIGNR